MRMKNNEISEIVLIDDDPINNFLCSKQINLFKSNVHITIFENPYDALNYLGESFSLPDLILLDINMPMMSGWELLEELKTLDSTIPPIFLVTSSTDQFDMDKAIGYNEIKSFISKPLDNSKLNLIFG